MSHKSFGPVPPDKFQEAIDAPAGKAGTILREFAPSFGLGSSEAEKQKYRVVFTRTVETTEKAHTEVEATSEEEAQGIAKELDARDLTWFDDGWEEPDDHYIESVKLVK